MAVGVKIDLIYVNVSVLQMPLRVARMLTTGSLAVRIPLLITLPALHLTSHHCCSPLEPARRQAVASGEGEAKRPQMLGLGRNDFKLTSKEGLTKQTPKKVSFGLDMDWKLFNQLAHSLCKLQVALQTSCGLFDPFPLDQPIGGSGPPFTKLPDQIPQWEDQILQVYVVGMRTLIGWIRI